MICSSGASKPRCGSPHHAAPRIAAPFCNSLTIKDHLDGSRSLWAVECLSLSRKNSVLESIGGGRSVIPTVHSSPSAPLCYDCTKQRALHVLSVIRDTELKTDEHAPHLVGNRSTLSLSRTHRGSCWCSPHSLRVLLVLALMRSEGECARQAMICCSWGCQEPTANFGSLSIQFNSCAELMKPQGRSMSQ